MQFREASGPQVARDPAAVTFIRDVQGRYLPGYQMSDGRLIPAAILTMVICGILIYVAFFRLAI